jgi:non-canonical purine NTP pyrophosphatase (RdgB/HAM1 family)
MNTLYFITGNDGKFREAKVLLPTLERLNVDLPEEQSLDAEYVIQKKLEAARSQFNGQLIVEDTSLYLDGLNGFPGPLIKWMLQAVGADGIHSLTQKIHNKKAVAKTIIGYQRAPEAEIHFFVGEVDGAIVPPNGNEGFGWDSIFQPDGLNETFAEMGDEFKPEFSMRTRAFKKLQKYLEQFGQ